MKIFPVLAIAAALIQSTIIGAENTAELEVHEWGTFTIVFGSDGTPIQWYQPDQALAELPDFVYPPRKPDMPSLKSGAPTFFSSGYYVRMETPVIYFYPQAPMKVSAEARMMNGHITEWFPNVATKLIDGTASWEGARWEGNLLPPTDVAAFDKIPKADGPKGAHYAHAREVPDAWIYQADPMQPPRTGIVKTADEAKEVLLKEKTVPQLPEKFIFYRGAGDTVPELYIVDTGNDSVRLVQRGKGELLKTSFLVDVGKEGMRWIKLPAMPQRKESENTSELSHSLAELTTAPVDEAGKQLAESMQTALHEAGLTSDEARAMVATWRDLWFTERGTRVLAILPRDWVDSVLPLKITPEPKKLTRVFVARMELFTRKREERFLSLFSENFPRPLSPMMLGSGRKSLIWQDEYKPLLSTPIIVSYVPKPPTQEELYGPLLRELGLGRFANAALTRATQLASQRMSEKFYELQKITADMDKQAATR